MDETERKQFLWDVFVTAMEGGIQYWSRTIRYHHALPDGKDDLDQFCATIQGTDDDGEDRGKARIVDARIILLGLRRIIKGSIQIRSDIQTAIYRGWIDSDGGAIDADAADCVVQAGLFGKIIFG